MIRIPWSRVFILTSFVAVGIVAFDLQLAPALNRAAKKIRSQMEKSVAEEVLPEKIEYHGWAEGGAPQEVSTQKKTSVAIEVVSDPVGATIMFNDRVVGTTPFEGSAPVGEKIQMAVTSPGFFPDSREVIPEGDKDLKISFILRSLNEASGQVSEKSFEETPVSSEKAPAQVPDPSQATNTDSLVEAHVRQELKAIAKKEKVSVPEVKDKFFTVQIESLASQQEASYRAALYQSMGHKAFVCRADMGDKGTWFRVRIGELSTKKSAENLASKLAPEIGSKPWIVQEDGLCPKLLSATPWDM